MRLETQPRAPAARLEASKNLNILFCLCCCRSLWRFRLRGLCRWSLGQILHYRLGPETWRTTRWSPTNQNSPPFTASGNENVNKHGVWSGVSHTGCVVLKRRLWAFLCWTVSPRSSDWAAPLQPAYRWRALCAPIGQRHQHVAELDEEGEDAAEQSAVVCCWWHVVWAQLSAWTVFSVPSLQQTFTPSELLRKT